MVVKYKFHLFYSFFLNNFSKRKTYKHLEMTLSSKSIKNETFEYFDVIYIFPSNEIAVEYSKNRAVLRTRPSDIAWLPETGVQRASHGEAGGWTTWYSEAVSFNN